MTDKVSNAELYHRTHSLSLSIQSPGHVGLRHLHDIPAKVAILINLPNLVLEDLVITHKYTKYTNIELDHCYQHSEKSGLICLHIHSYQLDKPVFQIVKLIPFLTNSSVGLRLILSCIMNQHTVLCLKMRIIKQ